MNNLNDLNEILFNQIRKLENDDLTDEQLDREIRKSESITKTATVILKNAELANEYRDIPMTESELYLLVELGRIQERAWLKDYKQAKVAEENGWKKDWKHTPKWVKKEDGADE